MSTFGRYSSDIERQRELLDMVQTEGKQKAIMAAGLIVACIMKAGGKVQLGGPDGEPAEQHGIYRIWEDRDTGLTEVLGYFYRGHLRSRPIESWESRLSLVEIDLLTGNRKPVTGVSEEGAREVIEGAERIESYRHLMPQLSGDLTTIEEP